MINDEIEKYKAHLRKLREEDSVLKIKNDSLSHAKVLVSNLFDHAKDEVIVYTSSLCAQFYTSDEILESAKSLRDRGVVPKFLIQYEPGEGDERMEAIKQESSIAKLLEIFGVPENEMFVWLPRENPRITLSGGDGESIIIHNFTVVDGKAFRYEKYETPKGECAKGEGKYTNALGCINDPESAMLLKSVFDEHFYKNKTKEAQ